MNIKKKLAFMIATIMTTSLLFGCGSNENSNSTNEVENQGENIEKDTEEKDTEENNNELKQEEIEKPKEIQEEVLVDNEIIKITLKDVGGESIFGSEMDIEIENKSEQSITVQLSEISVNGVMANTIFSSDISSGKKALDDITFMDETITEIINVEGVFRVTNSDSWDEIGEYEFKAITDESVASNTEISGTILLDNEFVTISYVGESEDSIFGPGINLEILNKLDKTIMVQVDEVSVDGYMVDTIFSSEISSNKKILDDITFMEDNIAEIKDIEGKFKVFYSESWDDIGEFEFNID